jgi:hypothetical protein
MTTRRFARLIVVGALLAVGTSLITIAPFVLKLGCM